MREIVRDRVLAKFNNRCAYCNSQENLEIDHIIPLSKGGKHDEINFQALCRACNRKKSNSIDCSQYFKAGKNKGEMFIASTFSDVMKYLKPNELFSILEQMFDEYCPENEGE